MQETKKLRIGIIGTGAIGGYYGALLDKAGYEVHYLLRSEYEAVKANGIQIKSNVMDDLHLPKVNAWQSAEEMPACDWLLVGTKATSNADLAPILTKVAKPGATVVLLQNGFAVEETLRKLLPESVHLVGGLCFICVHREAPGVIQHQAYGGVNLGYHSGPSVQRDQQQKHIQEIARVFSSADIESSVMDSIEQARWQKLVWNIPFNGLSVLLNAHTGQMMRNLDSRELVADLMQEVVDAASACGYGMPENFVDKMLRATDKMPDYFPSMYHDFTHQRPLELQSIYAAPLAAAKAAGFTMKKVEMLLQSLAFVAKQPLK